MDTPASDSTEPGAETSLTGQPDNSEENSDETSAELDTNPSEPPELKLAERVIDERNTFIMHSMLQDVVRRGTGVSARRLKRGDIAGKTGTTNDAADTWFNGYNPDLVTTVWVGFSNYDPLGARAFGSNTPLPIWIDYMEAALAGTAERFPPQPPGVVTMKIDPQTGEVAGPRQPNALFEYFLREYAPEVKKFVEPDQPERRNEDINAIDIFGE